MLSDQLVHRSNQQSADLRMIEQPEECRLGFARASGKYVYYDVVVGYGGNGVELMLQRLGQHLANTDWDCCDISQALIISVKIDANRLCHCYDFFWPRPRVGASAAGRPKAIPTGRRVLSRSYIRPESWALRISGTGGRLNRS